MTLDRTCGWCDGSLSGLQRKWCSENCRKRHCDNAHRAACGQCGVALASRSGFVRADRPSELCRPCFTSREEAAHRALLEDVAEMYREGLSYREMAIQLGRMPLSRSVSPEVHEARRLGLIGYRYTAYEGRAAA